MLVVVLTSWKGNDGQSEPERSLSQRKDLASDRKVNPRSVGIVRSPRVRLSERSAKVGAAFTALRSEIVESTIGRSFMIFDESLEDRRLTIVCIRKPSSEELSSWAARKDDLGGSLEGAEQAELDELFNNELGWHGFSESNFRVVAFRVPFDEDEPVGVSIYDKDKEPYKDGETMGIPKWKFIRGSDEKEWPFQELLKFE